MPQAFSQQTFLDGTKSGNNFIVAVFAGLIVGLISIVLWMGVALLTGPQSEFLAPGVGLLLGMTVRFTGNGTHPLFGILGGILTLITCVVADIFAVIESGVHPYLDLYEAVTHYFNLIEVAKGIYEQSTAMTYVYLGVTVVLAAMVSIRKAEVV